MAKKGKYIYGIIDCNRESFSDKWSLAGLVKEASGLAACETVSAAQIHGQTSPNRKPLNPVYTISFQDISAVVSDEEIADYNLLLKEQVARRLLKHQQVIEQVMEKFTVIPMRLGTFAGDVDEVVHILTKGYLLIKGVFHVIVDKIEIDVVATWNDFGAILREVGEEQEIRELKAALSANPGGVTKDDQIRIGMIVKRHLCKKREGYAFQILNVLKSVCQDIREHQLMDDTMVLNTACLINKAEREMFDKKVEELNAEFAERLNFRCIGPLPPYSFYTLEIQRRQREEIEWAKSKLGVSHARSKAEIKRVYQKLAFCYHPDKNRHKMSTENEFNTITTAYQILFDYCEAHEQVERKASSEKELQKDSILVKVRSRRVFYNADCSS